MTSTQNRFRLFANLSLIFTLLACGVISTPSIKASGERVGFKIQNDGHVEDARLMPSNVKEIFAEFYLDIPADTAVSLEIRWYVGRQLLYSYSGQHPRGYVVATLSRDPAKLPDFPRGNYTVEAWFLNTMLADISFVIR